MGCGRVFEGTYEQMYHSLNRLAALPPRTQVYCTHEYTLSNAKFALHVEPDNLEIQQRFEHVEALRMLGQPTLPSTIALELETNPFLRADSVAEFQRLRELKDNF
jgi:hydroxyacylglutathione hydrolase